MSLKTYFEKSFFRELLEMLLAYTKSGGLLLLALADLACDVLLTRYGYEQEEVLIAMVKMRRIVLGAF
jgi:hypothetical protein